MSYWIVPGDINQSLKNAKIITGNVTLPEFARMRILTHATEYSGMVCVKEVIREFPDDVKPVVKKMFPKLVFELNEYGMNIRAVKRTNLLNRKTPLSKSGLSTIYFSEEDYLRHLELSPNRTPRDTMRLLILKFPKATDSIIYLKFQEIFGDSLKKEGHRFYPSLERKQIKKRINSELAKTLYKPHFTPPRMTICHP